MRDYAKVSPQFWIGSTGRRIRKGGQEAQIVAMYLLTCPSSSMIGMYYLPVATIAHDTGLSIEGACKGLKGAIEAGFCSYDDESGVVWVHEMARYQIGDQLSAADKRCNGVQNDYDKMMENPFLSAFYERYHRAFNMKRRREYTAIDTSPLEAPSKALRSQEQEQEQETEKEQEQKDIRRTISQNHESDPEPKREATKRQPQLKRPDDVTEDTWQAFSALRKAKKAPLSGIALDRMRAEAGKAKITMDEAMQTCCLRGWTGFKAEWITDDRGGGQRVNGNAAPNSYVGLSQKDYGKTRMGGFLERVMSAEMKAKLNGGDK